MLQYRYKTQYIETSRKDKLNLYIKKITVGNFDLVKVILATWKTITENTF